jgi:hypothetical protein
MLRKLSKKRIPVIAGVVVFALAGIAYAFWSSGGTGTGTAGVANPSAQSVTITQTTPTADLSPGASKTLSGTVTNANSNAVHVDTVTASIAGTSDLTNCPASNFDLTTATATVNQTLAASTGSAPWTGVVLRFKETNANQDGCKNVTVNLSYSSN